MKTWIAAGATFAFTALLASGSTGGDPGNAVASANVNSRYTVESVSVTPVGMPALSAPLRERLERFVGVQFDQALVNDAVERIRREFHDRTVTTEMARGTGPNQVTLTFHIEKSSRDFDVQTSDLLYHSKRNFSFGLGLAMRSPSTRAYFGALTDHDDLVERYSGINGSYERVLANGRVRIGAEAASWRSQWGRAAGESAVAGELYRTRKRVMPKATFEIMKDLTLQLGVSLERLEFTAPAVRNELSSAVNGTLRFQRRWGLDSSTADLRQRFESAYGIRVGAPGLASDFSFTRHHVMARYGARRGSHEMLVALQAGLLNGRAPLVERFVAGNSRVLRGWNQWDIAPAGVDRLAAVSADYRWRHLRLAYDAGSARTPSVAGKTMVARQSIGIGLSGGSLWSGFNFLIAFPLREGRMEPVFIAGLNF